MTGPVPPAGAVAERPALVDRGEIARWRHTDRLPALEVSLRAAGTFSGYPEQPAAVTISTFPGRLEGVTDPREIRQCAWLLLAAAAWLERQHGTAPVDDDPQLTIYDVGAA